MKLSQKVKELIEECSSCQTTGTSMPVEPMQITPTEDKPWYDVAIDSPGPIPNNEQYSLVVFENTQSF